MFATLEHGYERLEDPSVRLAQVLGLATVPATIGLSLQSGLGPSIEGTPLLVAAIAVGFVYASRRVGSRRAGVQTGLTGSIGVITVQVAYMASLTGQPWSVDPAIVAILTPVVVVIGVALAIVAGVVGAAIGRVLATRLGSA